MTATATSQLFSSRNVFRDSEWIEMEDRDGGEFEMLIADRDILWIVLTLPPDNGEEFERFAAQWKRETAHLSSPSSIAMNHAYQRIIGMGDKAIPYILRELLREPNH